MASIGLSVDVRARLPADPFRCAGELDICQFNWVLSGEFARVLTELAATHLDDKVFFAALEPDPDVHYRTHYARYPAFTLSAAEISSRVYWTELSREPGEDPTGAIAYSADVVAVAGSSEAWAVFADRRWDVTLIASAAASRPWRAIGVPFVSAREALATFTEPDFKTPLPGDVRDSFLAMVRRRGESL